MIKYIWVIIVILVHVIAIGYVIHDFSETYEYWKKEERKDLFELFQNLDENTYIIVIALTGMWFIISIFTWVISKYGG